MPSLDEAAQRLRARWLAGVPATAAVLHEALAARRTRSSPDANETLIRLAHQIRSGVAGLALPEIEAAATRVEAASDAAELERASAALIEVLKRVHAAHPRERAEILVIDDDPFIGEFMRELVRNDDITIEQVTRAAAGLARLAERRWDVVVVDLVLPDADGRALLADIRELPGHHDTPLLVLSSKTGSLVKNECYLHGIDGFLPKPIDAPTFPALLESVLARARARASSPAGERTRTPPSEPARDPSLARARVLIAEDDVELALLLEHDLAADFEVVHARDGEQALALASASSFALVLLDFHMPPGRNGIEVLRELRRASSYRDTPILLLTALGSDAAIEEAFEAGASDYVTKPYTRRALLARLHRHLAQASTRS